MLSLSLVIIGLDNTILNVALPTLQHEFSASSSKLQWMVDSYLLVFAGLLLVFGTLGDRFGRKRALQARRVDLRARESRRPGCRLGDQVIAVRAAMGVGAALIMPATLSIIANLFTGKERRKAIGIWAALAAIGIGLGPLTGGLLLEWFDWSSVFMVNVPFAVAALLLGIRYVPESRDPRPGSFDLLGATLSTAGFSLLVYAIIEAPERGWTSGLVVGSLTASVALLGFFLWWERRVDDPMLDLGFFRSASFSIGTAAVSVAFFALLGAIFALTQYLQFVHGYSAIKAGAIMSPIALGLMMGAGSSNKAAERLGVARVVAIGLTGIATMLALTTLWEPHTGGLTLAIWFFGLALAMGWVMAPATDAVVGSVSAAKSGVASATNTVARMVSGALGVAVIGSLISSLYSSDLEGSLGALPLQAQPAFEGSIGAASAIAAQLPADASAALLATTGDAFTQAMGIGLLVAGALVAAMAVVVARFLPAREPGAARQKARSPACHRSSIPTGSPSICSRRTERSCHDHLSREPHLDGARRPGGRWPRGQAALERVDRPRARRRRRHAGRPSVRVRRSARRGARRLPSPVRLCPHSRDPALPGRRAVNRPATAALEEETRCLPPRTHRTSRPAWAAGAPVIVRPRSSGGSHSSSSRSPLDR